MQLRDYIKLIYFKIISIEWIVEKCIRKGSFLTFSKELKLKHMTFNLSIPLFFQRTIERPF